MNATANQFDKLTNAIASTDTSNFPGVWTVELRDDGDTKLIWTCDEKDVTDMSGDEPWAEWGGSKIIQAAGIGDYNDHKSGCDSYQDRYGDKVVTQWVCFSK